MDARHFLPPELEAVPPKLLEIFVRDRILAFVTEPAFAKRLYMTPDVMKQAATEAFAELSRPTTGPYGLESASQYRLVFRHDCLSLGCLDPDCGLCRQTLHRRCVGTFAPKYLSGDQLKAKCGACIRVEVFDHSTGLLVPGEQLADLHLEACVLEGKAYSELEPGMETEDDLEACMLLTNSQGRELLAPGKGAEQSDNKKIILKLIDGQAELCMSVLGSSIALLSGQKPPFRLLVRAVRSSSGQRARHIAHAVSDAFVVATQRVKQAQKSSIPHMEEHVSKLDFVGVQTQLKLQDIKGAAAASGVVGLSVIHNNITTVGQFKELVESSERDVQLQETLRKVLNFTAKGWEAARQHALRAVGTDNRMRIWCADDSMDAGLLFRCSLGRVDLHAPVGLLKKKSLDGGHITMEAVFTQQQGTYERGLVQQLQAAAADDWWRPGHPGWAIWPADSEHFLRQVCDASNAAMRPVQITAPVPATPHSAHSIAGNSGGFPGFTGMHMLPEEPQHSDSYMSQPREAPPMYGHTTIRSSSLPGHPRSRFIHQASPMDPDAEPLYSGGTASDPLQTSVPSSRAARASTYNNPPSWQQAAAKATSVNSGGGAYSDTLVTGAGTRPDARLPPSPFDAVRDPSNPPTSSILPAMVMAARQQAAAAAASAGPPSSSGAGGGHMMPGARGQSGPGLPGMPTSLPILSSAELDQIMELHRRIHSESDGLPHLLSRLSGLIHPHASLGGPGGGPAGAFSSQGLASIQPQSHAPHALHLPHQPEPPTSAADTPVSQADGQGSRPPESQHMMLRFSGKVSGILDDLSDAMAMLQDLMPNAEGDNVIMPASSLDVTALPPPIPLGLPSILQPPHTSSAPDDSMQPPKKRRYTSNDDGMWAS